MLSRLPLALRARRKVTSPMLVLASLLRTQPPKMPSPTLSVMNCPRVKRPHIAVSGMLAVRLVMLVFVRRELRLRLRREKLPLRNKRVDYGLSV